MALRRGRVKIAGIPEDLSGDGGSRERIAWLGSKVPPGEREEAEGARLETLAAKANLEL
ncbi:MAG: hypothetical protein OXI87_24930 [Albidovulum sp.]|nr:hypothetical protein [Albidovulum sp.]MDE0308101.1 hypothetical protein [Albidovulum sp.]MDE0532975.1 hypothetical protein [Albidovulum sp.]